MWLCMRAPRRLRPTVQRWCRFFRRPSRRAAGLSSARVRIPYCKEAGMIAKITSKNQLTLPKSVVQAIGATEYFDVEVRQGQIVLTPVRMQRGDAVRAKLVALGLTEADVAGA